MQTHRHNILLRRMVAVAFALGTTLNALANPTGMTVQSGTASAASSGSQLTVTASQNASLNWQSFNIAAGETTIFNQPSASSIVWNRINDQNPSQIYGSLQANGIVVLLNSSGFYFGPNSFVSAAGLVVSTANCMPPQNSGGNWEFNGPPPLVSIVNYGQIKIGSGGSAFLIADKIENHGSIEAPGGTIGLAAGQTVLLSERADGRGMSTAVTLPGGSVDNEGRLIADGGTIALNAQVVNQNGFIQANSVKDVNGTIELVASDQLNLGASSQILARGDNTVGGSAGGTVTLKSDNEFSDDIGSQIITTGGTQGGNGGNVEISAPNVLSLNSAIDASAQHGWSGGMFILDPKNITLGTSGTTSGGASGTIDGTSGTGTLNVNVNSAFQNINAGQILLEASGNITLGANTIWDLYASTGNKTSGLLTLEAGKNITFGDGSSIVDANDWSVTIDAGYNFASHSIQQGVGNINLTGSGSIGTTAGDINLNAGSGIQLGSGTVSSSVGNVTWRAGGDITLGDGSQITDGNGLITIDAGYNFANNSIQSDVGNIYLNGGLNGTGNGSIGTAAGNINLNAGNGIQLDSGTVSSSAGDITWQAGGDIQFGDGSQIADGSGTVTLNAGYNFANNTIKPGVGSIYLNAGLNKTKTGSIGMAGNINLKAGNGIQLGSDTAISSDSDVAWEAGGDILFGDGSQITDGNGSLTLKAGYNFVTDAVNYGKGSIYLNGGIGGTGGGSIQTAAGNISLIAGQDILVGSGFVGTTGGGSVNAWALAGDVNTGTHDYGYIFNQVSSSSSDPYYNVDLLDGVGGISTSGGGNVKITAGGNVTSYLPSGSDSGDAGTGTFATQGSGVTGDLTIIAGGNVTGHYAVANGTGKIYAGVEMDANSNPVKDASGNYVLNSSSTGNAGTSDNQLALSLISGGWTVNAANNIFLQEVRNPNGIFNNGGSAYSPSYHYFDYVPDAYVNLNAGNSVTLGTGLGANASSPPRNAGDNLPFIYAPILNIVAGAGGVELTGTYGQLTRLNELILFPSPQGSLTITTTGDLTGQYQANDGSFGIYDLIVSDSGYRQYYSLRSDVFGANDHGATPVHYGNPTPIVLNIFGDMDTVLLSAPEAAQITVGGNMNNSRFEGMNMSSDPNQTVQVPVREIDGSLGTATVHPGVTSINVAGDIVNRGEFTTITLPSGAQIPDIAYLTQAIDPSNVTLAANLAAELFYNSVTKQLTIQGAVTDDVLNLLQNLTVQVLDVNGQPQYKSDGNGNLSPVTQTVSVIDAGTAAALKAEYANLGPIPVDNGSGYLLGGGGQFNITARNIDLGTSGGIQSLGVSYDTFYPLDKNYRPIADSNGQQVEVYPLVQYLTRGADINVNVSDNLDMFSTSISSFNGGNIFVKAGGDVNAGSSVFMGNNNYPRGIFTSEKSDVTVIAGGDVNVGGSRIAAYDGGNVTVESVNGDVNAGNGANGYVTMSEFYVNPATHLLTTSIATIPGSGILATTFPDSQNTVGNILVETLNGDVSTSAGGIVQMALDGVDSSASKVEVLAGYELRDSAGNPLTAGDMAGGTAVLVSADRDIDAGGSGIIAENAVLTASGKISGVVWSKNSIVLNAGQGITDFKGLGKTIDANAPVFGPTVEFIGTEKVDAAGASPSQILSQDANGGGSTFAQGTAANATGQGMASDDATKMVASSDQDGDDKKKKEIALAEKIGRVTVILPEKESFRKETSQNHTSTQHL